jgi:hypothetical protein
VTRSALVTRDGLRSRSVCPRAEPRGVEDPAQLPDARGEAVQVAAVRVGQPSRFDARRHLVGSAESSCSSPVESGSSNPTRTDATVVPMRSRRELWPPGEQVQVGRTRLPVAAPGHHALGMGTPCRLGGDRHHERRPADGRPGGGPHRAGPPRGRCRGPARIAPARCPTAAGWRGCRRPRPTARGVRPRGARLPTSRMPVTRSPVSSSRSTWASARTVRFARGRAGSRWVRAALIRRRSTALTGSGPAPTAPGRLWSTTSG